MIKKKNQMETRCRSDLPDCLGVRHRFDSWFWFMGWAVVAEWHSTSMIVFVLKAQWSPLSI